MFLYVQFPLQSRFDSWQAGCELGSKDAAQMNEYGKNLSSNFWIAGMLSGVFCRWNIQDVNLRADLCFSLHHCGEWNAFKIEGYTASKAQYDFYYGNTHNRFWFQEEDYPCSNCCKS